MHAVAYTRALPTSDAHCFVYIEIERPEPSGFDLLVEIRAVSANPVDVKRRARRRCTNSSGRSTRRICAKPIARLESGHAYGKIALARPRIRPAILYDKIVCKTC